MAGWKNWLTSLLSPLTLDEVDAERIAANMRLMLPISLGVITFFGLLLAITSQIPWLTLLPVSLIILFTLVALVLLRFGKVKTACFLFLIALWAGLTIAAALNSGLASPALASLILIITAIGFLQGGPAGVFLAFLVLATVVGLYFAEGLGLVPVLPLSNPRPRLLTYHLMNLTMAVVSVYFISRRIRRDLTAARNHERDMEARRIQLQEICASLEQRVAARTAEISNQKEYFETLVKASPLAIVTLNLHHQVTACNPAFEKLFGYTFDEMVGRDLDNFVSDPTTHAEAISYTLHALHGETVHALSHRRRKDGARIDVEIFGVPVIVADQQVGILALYQDVTERTRAQEAIQESELRFRSFFELASVGLFIADMSGAFVQVNRALCEMLGFSPSDFSTMTISDLLLPSDQGVFHQLVNSQLDYFQVEGKLTHKHGRAVWTLINASLNRNLDGGPLYVIGQIQDITSRKEAEQHLHYLATHDTLTDLPNRAHFSDRLNHAITIARRNKARIGVVFMDLDTFKTINDSYGHEVGDRVLSAIGARLKGCLRESDTVSRLGGDEFAFIIENVVDYVNILTVVEKIHKAIMQPFEVDGQLISLTPSIGISLFPEHGEDAKTLLIMADKAMYRSKEEGKNQFQLPC